MREGKRTGRGGEGCSQNKDLGITSRHFAVKAVGFIFGVEMLTLSGIQPPSLAVPQVTGCPWDSLEQRL